ncbi:2-amino-4-hydroxy-6-hydroxymethyldihydropteridine diphosphokinase [Yoonia litorea]|uniref:2-amino-4-hydroxy-6-hydroxymethyldihydropteridine pyrophosphokinase n=1 Tax=Yoonia litorea TaxID=1123755 RepID=A0A1I6MXX8_9RHOB|nr:2-amino-4-hydroxy-6-hydroxymethyldihydropteridine diphosphokinase [Yoonia litorea]SFS20408.1 2-amino-4-hydroxy-6-hydroxymethyldihydropteridinediphosphokinase [Yoonia litorea]
MRQVTLISLGSNDISFWGSPFETVTRAVAALEALSVAPVRTSRFYKTPAFPKGNGPDFVNAVAEITTDLTAQKLLDALHAIEAEAGRERSVRWGQRGLDLDLLTFGQAVMPNEQAFLKWRDLPLAAQTSGAPEELILPHPRIQDRAFVLVPMCEIAPDWRHPVFGRTAEALCAALPEDDRAEVVPLASD